jgi:trimeric autotransporter adhesin
VLCRLAELVFLFNSGDTIGSIAFTNPTGNAFAAISCAIDATPGVSDFPGRLTFSTTPDNSATLTERLRITSEGLVGVGVSSPQNLLHLRSDLSGATTQLYLMNRTSGASVESRIAFTTAENDLADNRHAYIGAVTTGAGENGNSFVIATNPTGDGAQTRVFVSSTGNVGINTTNPSQNVRS